MNRKIPTRPHILRNELGFMILMVACGLIGLWAACGAAELILDVLGAGYDPRIGTPA